MDNIIPWFGRGYQVKRSDGHSVEYGFVTSGPTFDDCYFVRYWLPDLSELRTKGNSEKTPADCLTPCESVPQERVEQALAAYC